jgi:hypothetical protein
LDGRNIYSNTYYQMPRCELLDRLAEGKPAILLIKYTDNYRAALNRQSSFNGMHFVVARGFDTEGLYVNDPLFRGEDGAALRVDWDLFVEVWEIGGRYALVCNLAPNDEAVIMDPELNTLNGDIWEVAEIRVPLRIRYGPGTNTKTVGWLNPGDRRRVYDVREINGAAEKWLRIGTNQWCAAEYYEDIYAVRIGT